ncbi:MAG: hypothetical protein V1800_00295 [Candidatus Latescibacterota bacterium]
MVIRLGLVVASSPLEVGMDQSPALLRESTHELGKMGMELCPYETPVTDVKEAVKAGKHFYENRVHAVCVLAASWFEDYLLLDMLEECDVPVVLWARPGMETGSLCGTQQLGYVLNQLSRPCRMLYGEMGSPSALEQLRSFVSAAALRYRLRRARIGYLGHRVEGMTDTTADELSLKRIFGARVVGLDTQTLFERVAAVPREAVREKWEDLKGQAGRVLCGDEAGLESLQFHQVLRALVTDQMLDAVAMGCYPHLMGKVCLAASLMGEEGIPLSCEGDINGALGMLMLTTLSGNPTHNTDLLDPIPAEHAIVFSHCGSGGFSLAEGLSQITLASVRLMDQGLCCLFPAKPGPVTLVNLVATRDGYKMGALFGRAGTTEMLFPGNPLKVCFVSDTAEVLSWVAREGLGHHWMAAYGDFREPLGHLAGMVGCAWTACS